ncbi:MAG: hypothetical protein ACN6ON_07760 [Sphingobacterium sp.]
MKQELLRLIVGGMILTFVAFAQERKIRDRVSGPDGIKWSGQSIRITRFIFNQR